ncbi:2-hydroxy-palmitic acid dioxygenase MPO1-like [Rutidosis leptorrhynchoides]|uniref:2-hydroxy-palmitic acid dioxygenase MPO1-like n=1 Tax=Rutidosis leptorrhynchoides TaxID=125765 RepID=UPI003A99CC85
MGLVDLEKHFAFYAAYHSNPVNITIHMLFVWPIFFTAIFLFDFIPAPFSFPYISFSFFGIDCILIFNFGFLLTLIYAVLYVCFDYKAGSLAALLCIFCWVATCVLAGVLGFQLAWKVVLVVQLVSWTAQFIGHGLFEGRAPALVDNIMQALLMAPFFVLFEALEILFGYEPYPGFHDRVTTMVDAEKEDWRNKKEKLLT